MSGLTLLNGSTVDALERRDSELHYLRGLLAQVEERPAQLQVLPLLLKMRFGGVRFSQYSTSAVARLLHMAPL
jgi:hypothetical protein